MKNNDWFRLNEPYQVDSPALLLFPDRIHSNLDEMIRIAGSVKNLTPHVKTIKMTNIVRMELELGIRHFKCATIAEAEMIAMTKGCGKDGETITADFVLVAYQLNENKLNRLIRLIKKYPDIRFASLVDNLESAGLTNAIFRKEKKIAYIYIDIDNGMHRTGFPIDNNLLSFYSDLQQYPNLKIDGIHVYDGHINDSDIKVRREHWEKCFNPVKKKLDELKVSINSSLKIIYGGTPTFPFTSQIPNISCSPGTPVLWDYGYGCLFPDLPFIPAAVILTRIISKPGSQQITTDLGYKSISSENPIDKRIFLLNIKNYKIESQSEEHLVIKVPNNKIFNIGDPLYALPYHICPTVASYSTVQVVKDGEIIDHWDVEARRRKITI